MNGGAIVMNAGRIISRIKQYTQEVIVQYKIPSWLLIMDCIWNCLIKRSSIRDYFLYKFYFLNRHGKREFISGPELAKIEDKLNSKTSVQFLRNKEKSLELFSDYIERDWCGIEFHNTEEEYSAFTAKHSLCIAKPLKDSGGRGVHILDPQNIPGGGTLREYCFANNCLVEELIEQDPKIATLHEESINTIRVVVNNKKIVSVTLRIGLGESRVDNFSSGGMAAAIDIDTGIVISTAVDGLNRRFIKHPDSNVVIPGFAIPGWESIVELVLAASELIKGIPLIGFDIAISTKGPTIVEVNDSPESSVMQAPLGIGIRRKLDLRGSI